MKKKNVFAIRIFSILFVGLIYLCFSNGNKIKDIEVKTEFLKIQLKSLKVENHALTKVNSQLVQTNSLVAETVTKLKTIIN